MASFSELITRLAPYRKRLAGLFLVVGAIVVALQIRAAMPRPLAIRFDLGPTPRVVREVKIAYVPRGAVSVRGTTLRFPAESHPDGAPRVIEQEVELAPGRYEVVVHLSGDGFANDYTRYLRVPVDGDVIRFDLFDRAFAVRDRGRTPTLAAWTPAAR